MIEQQLHLVDVVTDPVRKLTDRQQLALEFIGSRDGVTADEIGAHLHARRPRRPHGVDERCDWCARDGRGVATSKALKPLVVGKRRSRGDSLVYVLRTGSPRAAETVQQSGGLPGDSWEDIFTPPTRSNTAEGGS